MSEKWVRDLDVLDRLEMPASVRQRVGQTPTMPEPGRPLGRRLVTIGVAFAVFLAAGAFAWQAFRRPSTSQPVAGPASSAHGTILWPERTTADLASTQALVDGGDSSVDWRL